LSDHTGSPVTDLEADAMVEAARINIADALGTVLDDEADLARIYAQHGQQAPTRAAAAADSQVNVVCDRVGMLESALATATRQGPPTLLGIVYLKAVRRLLFELRTGLLNRRLARDEALRLLSNAQHNLREATRILRGQPGPAEDTAVHTRIGELLELASSMTSQLEAAQDQVIRLFDHSGDPALVPSGH
jgi:hypothetical protein